MDIIVAKWIMGIAWFVVFPIGMITFMWQIGLALCDKTGSN